MTKTTQPQVEGKHNYRNMSVIEWTPNNFWLLEKTGIDGSYTPIARMEDIIIACNSHYELVEALKTVIGIAEAFNNRYGSDFDKNKIAQAKQAILKAGAV